MTIACLLDDYKIHSRENPVTSYELACMRWGSLVQEPEGEETLVFDVRAEAREYDRIIERIALYRHTNQTTPFEQSRRVYEH
jgi:hypothetical protein